MAGYLDSSVFGWKTRARGDGSLAFEDGAGEVAAFNDWCAGSGVLRSPDRSSYGA